MDWSQHETNELTVLNQRERQLKLRNFFKHRVPKNARDLNDHGGREEMIRALPVDPREQTCDGRGWRTQTGHRHLLLTTDVSGFADSAEDSM